MNHKYISASLCATMLYVIVVNSYIIYISQLLVSFNIYKIGMKEHGVLQQNRFKYMNKILALLKNNIHQEWKHKEIHNAI